MPGSSRLVRSLSESLSLESQTHPEKFSERLAQKIDFAGSVKLSDAQGEVRMIDRRVEAGLLANRRDVVQGGELLDNCQQAFIRVRRAISQSIEAGFHPDKSIGRIKLPEWDEVFIEAVQKGEVSDKQISQAAEPFSKFYRAQQSDMTAKVQGLRVHVCEVLENYSPALSKLVVLDKALEEALSIETRKHFLQVPKLLAQCFVAAFERPLGENADLFEERCVDKKITSFLEFLKVTIDG